MQRHFSSRGEAHAEIVAAKMRASHRPSSKSGPGAPIRGQVPETWKPQATAIAAANPKKKEATGSPGKEASNTLTF